MARGGNETIVETPGRSGVKRKTKLPANHFANQLLQSQRKLLADLNNPENFLTAFETTREINPFIDYNFEKALQRLATINPPFTEDKRIEFESSLRGVVFAVRTSETIDPKIEAALEPLASAYASIYAPIISKDLEGTVSEEMLANDPVELMTKGLMGRKEGVVWMQHAFANDFQRMAKMLDKHSFQDPQQEYLRRSSQERAEQLFESFGSQKDRPLQAATDKDAVMYMAKLNQYAADDWSIAMLAVHGTAPKTKVPLDEIRERINKYGDVSDVVVLQDDGKAHNVYRAAGILGEQRDAYGLFNAGRRVVTVTDQPNTDMDLTVAHEMLHAAEPANPYGNAPKSINEVFVEGTVEALAQKETGTRKPFSWNNADPNKAYDGYVEIMHWFAKQSGKRNYLKKSLSLPHSERFGYAMKEFGIRDEQIQEAEQVILKIARFYDNALTFFDHNERAMFDKSLAVIGNEFEKLINIRNS